MSTGGAMSTAPIDRTAAARAEMLRRAADRAVDDPQKLAKAARIVRQALARQALEPADVLPDKAAS